MNDELNFALKRNLSRSEFQGQSFLINRFKETMPEQAMNLHRRSDHCIGLWILVHFGFSTEEGRREFIHRLHRFTQIFGEEKTDALLNRQAAFICKVRKYLCREPVIVFLNLCKSVKSVD